MRAREETETEAGFEELGVGGDGGVVGGLGGGGLIEGVLGVGEVVEEVGVFWGLLGEGGEEFEGSGEVLLVEGFVGGSALLGLGVGGGGGVLGACGELGVEGRGGEEGEEAECGLKQFHRKGSCGDARRRVYPLPP